MCYSLSADASSSLAEEAVEDCGCAPRNSWFWSSLMIPLGLTAGFHCLVHSFVTSRSILELIKASIFISKKNKVKPNGHSMRLKI